MSKRRLPLIKISHSKYCILTEYLTEKMLNLMFFLNRTQRSAHTPQLSSPQPVQQKSQRDGSIDHHSQVLKALQ